jgi:phosphoglycerate dehydrogenase-like enzyme
VRDPEARKLVLYPEVDEPRVRAIRATLAASGARDLVVANCSDEAAAIGAIVDADALFGKATPAVLAAAERLRWVQSATASLEHYLFPALVEHPCVLTNMRGLFSDVIADHVFGYILCFARNLHRYWRQQQQHRWAPIGGEAERSSFSGGPCFVSGMDRAHQHVSDLTLGIVGLGHIGAEVVAFGMRILSVDPVVREAPAGAEPPWPIERLDELLAASDYVAICAPHTPRTAGLFHRARC